jgi:DNA repair protein RadD
MELRNYQQEAVEATWSQLRTPQSGHPLIVMPTGSGKSAVIAKLAIDAVNLFQGRVVILQHRKELIEQNADKVRRMIDVPIPIGLYSAGLNRRQINEDIILGGIQSIYNKAHLLGRRHLVIVDECHLIPRSSDGMFHEFFDSLGSLNPNLKIVGLTATPYRTDSGKLYGKECLFPRVTYDAEIQSLIAQGYLCPLSSDHSKTVYDTSKLHIRAGEFKSDEMAALFGDDFAKIQSSCEEIVARSQGRKSILVFCSGVVHAQTVAEILSKMSGEEVGCVTGDVLPLERVSLLTRFKNQQLRWLTNCDVLTTGFDAPCIDMIAILRATMSPGLFAQMCGRGLRLHDAKRDCVVLDFGNNIRTHGPIDAIDFNKRAAAATGNGDPDNAPKKTCPGCQAEVALSARVCECGFEFPKPELKHDATPDDAKIFSEPIEFEVTRQFFGRHEKKSDPNAPPTFRVDYVCREPGAEGDLSESETISEWVCIEHEGFARGKAVAWWLDRSIAAVPDTIDEAVDLANRGLVAQSRTIFAKREGRWWRILRHVLDEIPTEEMPIEDEWSGEELPF